MTDIEVNVLITVWPTDLETLGGEEGGYCRWACLGVKQQGSHFDMGRHGARKTVPEAYLNSKNNIKAI